MIPKTSNNYITLEVEENRLKISITDEGRELLANFDGRSVWYALAEDLGANSEWMMYDHGDQPSSTGWLTSAPIFVNGAHYGDSTFELVVPADARVFWFPNYAVEDEIDTLVSQGVVYFDEA